MEANPYFRSFLLVGRGSRLPAGTPQHVPPMPWGCEQGRLQLPAPQEGSSGACGHRCKSRFCTATVSLAHCSVASVWLPRAGLQIWGCVCGGIECLVWSKEDGMVLGAWHRSKPGCRMSCESNQGTMMFHLKISEIKKALSGLVLWLLLPLALKHVSSLSSAVLYRATKVFHGLPKTHGVCSRCVSRGEEKQQ